MAEGEDPFAFKDAVPHHSLDNDETNTTFTFQPEKSSTPYQPGAPFHGGERIEMKTYMHEEDGPPSFDEKVPLLPPDKDRELRRRLNKLRYNEETGILNTTRMDTSFNLFSVEQQEEQIELAKGFIRGRYPHFNFEKLVIGFSRKNPMELVVFGERGGETKIFKKDGSDLLKSFVNATFIKKELGPPAETTIMRLQKQIDDSKKEEKKFYNLSDFCKIKMMKLKSFKKG